MTIGILELSFVASLAGSLFYRHQQSRTITVEANLAHEIALVEEAAGQGPQMVVLPELFSCSYQPMNAGDSSGLS